MNRNNFMIRTILGGIVFVVLLTGCKKLALQHDHNRDPVTIDPHVNMTAWQYLKSRALGTNSFG